MITRSIKRKLLRAKISLNQTVQKILDINRRRKNLKYAQNSRQLELALKEELRVLNKIAEQQARLVQHYESYLSQHHHQAQY